MEPLELATASHESMVLSTEKYTNRLTTEQQAGNVSLLEKLPKYLMLISPCPSLKLGRWQTAKGIRRTKGEHFHLAASPGEDLDPTSALFQGS